MKQGLLVLGAGFGIAAGCLSSSDGQVLQSDLFETQKRLLQLETKIEQSGTQGAEANRRGQRMAEQLSQLEAQLGRVEGEQGRLRMGVLTGELPGHGGERDSVAQFISRLEQRMVSLETNQVEIYRLLKDKEEKNKNNKTSRAPLRSYAQLSEAFTQKRFAHIHEDGASLLRSAASWSKANAVEAQYIIAESHFKVGALRDAALEFRRLLEAHPESPRAAAVTQRLGDCFRLLGDAAAAKHFYTQVTERHGRTDEAKRARAALDNL